MYDGNEQQLVRLFATYTSFFIFSIVKPEYSAYYMV